MSSISVLDQICLCGVIPILVPHDLEQVGAVGAALTAGGIAVVEVTLRTDAAIDALRILTLNRDILAGAGTVLTPEQVELSYAAGARFVVTPGFSAPVVERCQELGIPVIPGVATATDIISVLNHGIRLMKFFPAEASGGLNLLRSLHGPFPDVRFIPTGGIDATNATEYLSQPFVAAIGGSWMLPPQHIREGHFDEITRLAASAVRAVSQARS